MKKTIFTEEECSYLKSFYNVEEEIDGSSPQEVTRDDGSTFYIRYRKKNHLTFCTIYNEEVNNFLTNKLQEYKVKKVDSFKIMKYLTGDALAPHYDLGGYGYEGNYMTISIMLSDGTEYTGGDLIVEGVYKSREIGSVSSFLRTEKHEVTEVLSGERMSLVIFLRKDQVHIETTLI